MAVGAREVTSGRLPQPGRKTTDTYDPKFGWETAEQKATRLSDQAHYDAQNRFRTNASSNVNYSMAYTDPKTGLQMRYDPSTGGGGGGSRSGSGGSGGGAGTGGPLPSVAEIQQYLPAPVPRTPMPAQVPHPSPVDRSRAEGAAYGRAKDQIGASTGGAIKALQRQMSSRGISGSGLEAAGIGRQIGIGAGQLGEVARDQAIEGLKRDYAETDRNYAGDIGQRSTDMGYQTSERGQDINYETSRASMIPALLSLLNRSRTGAAY